ncbi:MAG: J domain-containing protein, partial [Actinomycetota bacterium]|nr:J domain-containing protein [Actinomycetota bacterium]
MTDRTDPYEIIGVRRDASLAEIRISYRRSTQILAPERFAIASDTVRAEAARRLAALNSAMESIEAERAAESGSALGSLSFGGPAVAPAAEPSMRSTAVVDEPPPLAPPAHEPEPEHHQQAAEAVEVAEAAQEAPVAEPEPPPAAETATEDDLPAVGEDTSEVPLVVA